MAMSTSGPISFADLRTETGISGAISLGDGKVQDLIGRTSNIDMNTARGKTSTFQYDIASNTSRSFITTMAYDAGWQGTGDLFAVIGLGTVTSTIVTGSILWGDITLLNSGTIVGKGGNGGGGLGGFVNSGTFSATVIIDGRDGFSGADGLVVNTPSTNRVQRLIRLNNLGGIYSGGGGGGGGDAIAAGTGAGDVDMVGGGGGGGGAGRLPGAGGAGGVVSVINGGGTAVNGNAGQLADQNNGGQGGNAGAMPRFGQFVGGRGGTGGNLGAGGAAGGANNASPSWGYQGSGGPAGYAILGYSNLTVDRIGTTVGTLG
jgi:hypothetical protein